MKHEGKAGKQSSTEQVGLAAWLLRRVRDRLCGLDRRLPRLALVERVRWHRGSRWLWLRRRVGGLSSLRFKKVGRHSMRSIARRVQHSIVRRGCHGGHVGNASGCSCADFVAARFECAIASIRFNAVADTSRPDADHAVARDPDVRDAAGSIAGGVSFFAPGIGHADRALQPHPDGTGVDDDVVSDGSGFESSRAAGGRAVSPGQVTGFEAVNRGAQPVKHFLLRYAREGYRVLYCGRTDCASE